MLFHSQGFLLFFLPLALLLYYRGERLLSKERVLLYTSLALYAGFDIRFLLYLIPSALLSWCAAWWFFRTRHRAILTLGIIGNLATLGFFKYYHFFAGELSAFISLPALSILVPLGISFITFEHISYLVDIRRGNAGFYPLPRYLTYISFFPHLIAGPIVRHYELMPQLLRVNAQKFLPEQVAQGVVLLLLGLAKKVLIADQIAPFSDSLFAKASSGAAMTLAEAWLAPFSFGVQIYYDFSGYTDMALGIALMFGILLPDNFSKPYAAPSVREFWRRWHMTLSRLLRDYVYIPLGGNRKGISVQCAAILFTMALCGLWHGASWFFVLWGVWHGVLMVINALWSRYSRWHIPAMVSGPLTLLFVMLGWTLFRVQDWTSLEAILRGLAYSGAHPFALLELTREELKPLYLVAFGLLAAILGPTSLQFARERFSPRPAWGVVAACVLIFILLEIGKGAPNDFIYFQF